MKSRKNVLIISVIAVLLILSIIIGIQRLNKPAQQLKQEKQAKQELAKPTEQIREENNPIPFNNNSGKQEWRLGFRVAPNVYLLELLSVSKDICAERDLLVREAFKVYGSPKDWPTIVTFPFSKATKLKGANIINPEKWTVIDMNGMVQKMSFTQLATLESDSYTGCWYMGSNSLMEKNLVFHYANYVDDRDLVFGITGNIKERPIVRLPVISYTKDSFFLPKGYQSLLDLSEIKRKLGDKYNDFIKSIKTTSGSTMRASVNKGVKEPDILWLLQWRTDGNDPSYPHNMQENIWGIFKAVKEGFEPLYISETASGSGEYDKLYGVEFVAAVDLNGDELDEIIIRVSLYEGRYYKVFTLKNNILVGVYNSFYFGL
jgi:hypothetical protein